MLADEDNYGYGIVTALREAGFTDLAEGTVYPALTRLGPLVISSPTSSARPAGWRASTRTTADGRADPVARRESWHDLVASVGRVSGLTPSVTHPKEN